MSAKTPSKVTGNKCPYHAPRFPIATRDVVSKDIGGISDLVVWAPIKEGFIDAFANVTYETRLKAVAEALHKVRKNVREFQLLEPFSDTAKKILSLLDFRIGIVDRDVYGFNKSDEKPRLRPQKFMYLVATFDGPWEPYMRLIWNPLGTFLDLVLCNCDTYIPARESSFEDYAQWVRDHQLDSAIFYSTSGLTVKDKIYLEQLERAQREMPPSESENYIAQMTSVDPVEQAANVRSNSDPEIQREVLRLALEALNVLYKLTHLYPADVSRPKGGGRFLHRAAQDFLEKIDFKARFDKIPRQVKSILRHAYLDPLAWYENFPIEEPCKRTPWEKPNTNEIQKGILSSYDDNDRYVSNGALLMVSITNPENFKNLMAPLLWSWEAGLQGKQGRQTGCEAFNSFFKNLAFSFKGLQKLNFSESELKSFPKEFREGMAARAPVLGDVHNNHPQRWKLPKRNWPKSLPDNLPPISTQEIDAVIQLRSLKDIKTGKDKFVEFEQRAKNLDTPTISKTFEDKILLTKAITLKGGTEIDSSVRRELQDIQIKPEIIIDVFCDFFKDLSDEDSKVTVIEAYILFLHYLEELFGISGMKILGVQSNFRKEYSAGADVDHFGFRDGISQPVVQDNIEMHDDPTEQNSVENSLPLDVKLGDIICGQPNLLGDYEYSSSEKQLQINGSFLAIRKLRQDVLAFDEFLSKHSMIADANEISARVVGRYKNGKPLIRGAGAHDNSFDYKGDKNGLQCPFASHIRRANPRTIVHGRKTPKIVRRGMSYGNPYTPGNTDERGVLFMAYCSNLAEQFETIQRWINGGNSSDVGSAQFDPLLAPLPKEGKRVFRFASQNSVGGVEKVHRLEIDKPFVELEWGLYGFAPSKQTLNELIKRDHHQTETLYNRQNRGRLIVEEIEALQDAKQEQLEWKILLEDQLTKDPSEHAITPDVWNYIRSSEVGGAYRVESGILGRDDKESSQPVVLVAHQDLIEEVLSIPEVYSVSEQFERVLEVYDPIYVTMDPHKKHIDNRDPKNPKTHYYDEEAHVTNEALFTITEKEAFASAYIIGKTIIGRKKAFTERRQSDPNKHMFKMELRREYLMPALAAFCKEWYGIPDITEKYPIGEYIISGGWGWDDTLGTDRKPRCPGDYLAPSRGTFYPRPTKAISDYAVKHGERLRVGIEKIVKEWRAGTKAPGPISKAILESTTNDYLVARNVIGSMTGALPPMEGNLRGILFDWIEENVLWDFQGQFVKAYADFEEREGGKPADPRVALSLKFDAASETVIHGIVHSMCQRPAPDLMYRTAKNDIELGNIEVKQGDLVILSLVSATQASLKAGAPDISTVFGGNRTNIKEEKYFHSCPAKKMAMGGMLGILTAFLDAGKIVAQPASLIVEISQWH